MAKKTEGISSLEDLQESKAPSNERRFPEKFAEITNRVMHQVNMSGDQWGKVSAVFHEIYEAGIEDGEANQRKTDMELVKKIEKARLDLENGLQDQIAQQSENMRKAKEAFQNQLDAELKKAQEDYERKLGSEIEKIIEKYKSKK